MKFRNSLVRKAVGLITLIMILAGLLAGILVFSAVSRGANDTIALQLNETAIRESKAINKSMIQAETSVKSIYALASDLVVQAEDMKDAEKRTAVRDAVGEVFQAIGNDSDYVYAYYMTFDPELIHERDGIFCSKDENGVLQSNEITDIAIYAPDDVEHIGWYTIPKRAGKAVWLEPYYNKNVDRWLISYVIPLFKDEKMVAVIGIDFDFQTAVGEVDQIHFLDTGYAFLKNADGSIHYHKGFFDEEAHGDEVCEIPEESQELFASGETRDKAITYTYDKEKWVGVLTRLENGMILCLVDKYQEVYSRRNAMLTLTVLLAAVFTLIATLIMHMAARSFIRPIEDLTLAMSKMENGDYAISLPPDRTDEIGVLIKGTRLLADTLEKQKAFNESELAKRNRMLETAIIDAQDANRAKTAFLSNMSHDIRTPMNAIIGLSDLTKKHLDDKGKVEYYVDQISLAGKQLLGLINNVLEISRIESNRVDIEEENTDTEEVYQGLIAIFSNQARAKNLNIRFHKSISARWLYMDRTHVEEILMNLVSNAMKYTQDGGQIFVSFETLPGEDAEHVRMKAVVKDNGIGMSEEYQKHLFESFERENSEQVRKIEGTGLGLSIVKRLVDLMGGTISVSSAKGLGTSVTVEIPHRIGPEMGQKKESLPPAEDTDFSGKRILIAEDIDINAMIIEAMLAEYGIKTERARDGLECVEMLKAAEADYYDMIFTDIRMPNMDGYQAAKAIRALEDKAKARIPIVAMTANAFREDRIKAMDAGMNGHIAKPVDPAEVLSTLSRIRAFKHYAIDTEELNEFKDRYIARGCMCGYYIYRDDKEASIVFSDAVTEEIYGCQSEEEFMEFVKGSFKNMVHPDDLAQVEQKILDQQETSEHNIDNVTYRILRRDGEIRKVRDIGYKTFNGREMLFYVYVADVTDLEEADENE